MTVIETHLRNSELLLKKARDLMTDADNRQVATEVVMAVDALAGKYSEKRPEVKHSHD